MEGYLIMYKYFWIFFVLLHSYESYSVSCLSVFSPSDIFVARVRTERNLEKQGFSSHYTNQFGEAVRLVELKRRWIKKGADPKNTHIPYFAQKIDAHIEEIRKGIKASSLSDVEKSSRLETLMVLEREASSKKRASKVTYYWWNIFNIRLIALVESSVESAFDLGLSLSQLEDYQIVYERLQELKDKFNVYVQMMESFPNIVLVPTIGEIGLMAFNQTMSESIHFIGVSGRAVYVDGKRLTPEDYFKHDVEHVQAIEEYLQVQDLSFFHLQFKERIRYLAFKQREQQELAYFLLLRERDAMNLQSYDYSIFQRSFGRMLRQEDIINFLPASIRNRQSADKEEYKKVLKEYFDDMIRGYNAISQVIIHSN